MNQSNTPTIQDAQKHVEKLARGFIGSQVLFFANEHRVFIHLENGATAEDLAHACGWSNKATQRLLDALLALGLVNKNRNLYLNSAAASLCLVPEKTAFLGNYISHLKDISESWEQMENVFSAGISKQYYDVEHPKKLSVYMKAMEDLARPLTPLLLNALDLSSCHQLLDLGGGPAVYSLAFLSDYPNLSVTLFDFPEMLDIVGPALYDLGTNGRCRLKGGNMLEDDFGGPYDCIFLSNIIHFFDWETNLRLVQKCHNALRGGGKLVIKDFIMNDLRTAPPYALMFGLHMFLTTKNGSTYSTSEISTWSCQAGFGPARCVNLNSQNQLLIVERINDDDS